LPTATTSWPTTSPSASPSATGGGSDPRTARSHGEVRTRVGAHYGHLDLRAVHEVRPPAPRLPDDVRVGDEDPVAGDDGRTAAPPRAHRRDLPVSSAATALTVCE
jgi:hypothetical protein